MPTLEGESLQGLGLDYLHALEQLSISIFFYGASLFVVYDSSTSSITLAGVFVVLFSASVVIFMFVLSFLEATDFLPVLLKFDRRRGFPNRTTAAMFAATFINFSASSLKAGNHVAGFVVFVRTALMDHPLSEKPEMVNDALRKMELVTLWAGSFPVSSNLPLPDYLQVA